MAFSFAAEESPDPGDMEGSTSAEPIKNRKERKLQEERLDATRVAKAFRSLHQFGILLPSGIVARATSALVSVPALKGSKTTHVDLMVGTVGSGTFWDVHWDDEDPAFQRIELERRYGIFLGCPVMVKTDEVRKVIKSEFPRHTEIFDFSPKQRRLLNEAASDMELEKRPVGRPKKEHAVFEEMVHQEFRRRLGPEGDLHMEEKKVAVESAAIEFVFKQTCRIWEPSHTTIGAYLAPLYALQGHGK